ncbi:unnamed protein product [Peronospora farinosa]|uniref:3'-5' exonuclease domain-containing protein n=1 Tax=Peronospora farinosa TaxID=134698 RepID=A0AAV0SPM3_9STRA|nr:unnamed protein product [Peronospora farinosa]CAI5705221.1 unnamed protein product [Peronospora farinosa]
MGQLKFLFRCNFSSKTKRDFHVESSVKFFLLHSVEAEGLFTVNGAGSSTTREENGYIPLEQFVGPHLGETLAYRVQEVNRKLAMRHGESVRTWLKENYSDNVVSHVVLRGYVFQPLHDFVSTSETTIGHDWFFHRNPVVLTQMTCTEPSRKFMSNPSIATNHLRGWWTTNLETDLPAKVRANDQALLGESRFVLLPKLHWLCPVIATEENASGQVIVEGDSRMGIPRVEALTIEELLAFVREYFQNDASSIETNKARRVLMPLLVAEIVHCPKKVEFGIDDGRRHWYELSRGFVLDPKCWDSSLLCREPVRFKRTLHRNNATGSGELEFEARRNCDADEAFIKPDKVETIVHEQQQHKFDDPISVAPHELCRQLLSLLAAQDILYTHADLKRSTRELFLLRRQHCLSKSDDTSSHCGDESAYLRLCMEFLVLHANDIEVAKHARRVGYLLLDVFDGLNCEVNVDDIRTSSLQECSSWVELLTEIAYDTNRWNFFNLVLRAIDLSLTSAHIIEWGGFETSRWLKFLDKLLASQSSRWNAVVVEVIRVFQIGKLVPHYKSLEETADFQKIQSVFDEFVHQCDWQSAERLALVVQNHDMVQTLFQHLSLLNMTKALKRLQKVSFQTETSSLALTSTTDGVASLEAGETSSAKVLGYPINHAKNRSLNEGDRHVLEWKYIDTIPDIEVVVRHLEECTLAIHTVEDCNEQAVLRNMLVGIDCEWRPQHLTKVQTSMTSTVHDGEQSEKPSQQIEEDQTCLSIYQLAVGDIVYVIDVQVLGAAAATPLRFIWNASSRLRLIGFCVSSDLQMIKKAFPEVEVLFESASAQRETPVILELKKLALFRQIPAKSWGLARLYRICIGEQMDKEQQCSDWGIRPLSYSQIEYAAKDAYAVQRLALHLLADVDFAHAGAENCSVSEYVWNFTKSFDASRNHSFSWTMASVSQPLGKQHVKSALEALGVAPRFMKCDTSSKVGVIVKSIALLIRRPTAIDVNTRRHIAYAVVVLPLDRSIEMEALGALLQVNPDDISLADQETLVRVFGYTRGCLGPIGLREQRATRIFIDNCLQHEEYLLCGGGAVDEVYAIAPDVLIAAVNASVANLSR